MFYLIVTKIGYYISLSRVAAENHCRSLGARNSDIIVCSNMRDVESCLLPIRRDYEPVELLVDRVTYWTPIRCRVLVNLKAGRTCFCRSDGSVHMRLENGRTYDFKICQGQIVADKKTVGALKKLKTFKVYDFSQRKTVTVDLAK